MSISYKQSTQATVTSGTTVTLSLPVAKDDVVVLITVVRSTMTPPTGYTLLHSEGVQGSSYVQTTSVLYKKITADGTETVTVTQSSSLRLYAVMFVAEGVESVSYTGNMNYSYTSQGALNKTVTKPQADSSCIWYASCIYAQTGSGTTYNYIATPNDIIRQQSPAESSSSGGVRLACWFDDGTGAQAHTLTYPAMTDNNFFVIDGVLLVPHEESETKYLIEDESQLYTVQNSALVPISGTLSAALFASDGFDSLQNVGALLETLTRPTVYAWNADELPSVTVSVDATPYPQDIIAQTALVEVIGVDEITATYAGNPLVAINVDNVGWICYNSIDEQWEAASDHDGMSIATMQSIPAEEWETLLTGASSLKVRITLATTTDSVTAFEIAFLTN